MATADDIRTRLLAQRSRVPASQDLLSSGSTVLNLACSGRRDGAFKKGGIYLVVGDSSSGKSFLTRTMFAEACLNPKFKGYDLIDDDPENGASMDYAAFFGKEMARRVDKRASTSLEKFYDNLVTRRRPFIALLDSLDALRTEADLKKTDENRKARAKGKEEKGSYGTKAKANASNLVDLNRTVTETGSIAIIICQTRENIGLDAMFNPKVRSGGTAPTFFAQMELWTSIRERLKSKKIYGKERRTGIVAKVHVKKNRQTGRDRNIEIPLYYASGLADVDGNVRFLHQEGYWSASKEGVIDAADFAEKGTFEELVRTIEDNEYEDALAELVETVWNDIDAKTAVVRKSKYV